VKLDYKVEVFKANMSVGRWISMSGGLGGQAIFISKRFSKSVSAHGEVEPDATPKGDIKVLVNVHCLSTLSHLRGSLLQIIWICYSSFMYIGVAFM
jgi:hypothetical protein